MKIISHRMLLRTLTMISLSGIAFSSFATNEHPRFVRKKRRISADQSDSDRSNISQNLRR